MNIEIMLDLEFMGKPPTAAITAIGAVAINADTLEVMDTFTIDVSLISSVASGMTMDADTVLWWLQQDQEARRPFFQNKDASSLRQCLTDFEYWVQSCLTEFPNEEERQLTKVWGYGASADNEIMKHAFSLVGVPCPWTFREDRCFRAFMDGKDDHWVNYGIAHTAGDDAMAQALTLISVYQSEPGRIIADPAPEPAKPDPLFDPFNDDLPF